MDSSVSPKDEIWFLRVCHHISNAVYIRIDDRWQYNTAHALCMLATDTHSEYVILIVCPLQQWLCERASVLRCNYISRLVIDTKSAWKETRKQWILNFVVENLLFVLLRAQFETSIRTPQFSMFSSASSYKYRDITWKQIATASFQVPYSSSFTIIPPVGVISLKELEA